MASESFIYALLLLLGLFLKISRWVPLNLYSGVFETDSKLYVSYNSCLIDNFIGKPNQNPKTGSKRHTKTKQVLKEIWRGALFTN